MPSKPELRQRLLVKRQILTPQQVHDASELVATRVLDIPDWALANLIHVYTAKADWQEIDAAPLLGTLRQRYPAMQIESSAATANAPLPSVPYDIIIVPVLGFDSDGFRLGLGGGWYDRFLARQPQALTIGFAYSWAKVDKLPHEPHDVPLGCIITEYETILPTNRNESKSV
jgi:5-formyltetrahydrofolate cyclo-ligase